MQMQPFERKGTSELVANQLRKAIVDGTFKPGQQLAEAALSEQLGLGRGTIREALQRLIQEGLVSNHLHRGVFVAVLSDEDIVDVYFARSAAEVAAARLLTMRKDAETFARLDEIVSAMQAHAQGEDWVAVAEVDVQFHEEIIRGTGSKRLWRMYETLIAETRMCLNPTERQYPRSPNLVDQHREILDAMRSSDLDEVETRITRHLKDAMTLLAGRSADSDFFRDPPLQEDAS